MDERFVKFKGFIEPLVEFVVKELPVGMAKDFAFTKAQELVWWIEKSINDDILAKKEPKKDEA